MFRDVRFAWRMLLKQPGFTIVAVLTLALGIGATAAVFSLIQGVLLTPPPYRRARSSSCSFRRRGPTVSRPPIRAAGPPRSGWNGRSRRRRSKRIAAYAWTFNFLVESDGSESLEGMVVTQRLLPRRRPPAGAGPRVRRVRHGRHRPPPVIILGYDLWQRKFNGDPNIVGKTIRMSRRDTPPTVIGVMPPGRSLSSVAGGGAGAELQRQRGRSISGCRRRRIRHGCKQPSWNVVGRLKHGVTPEQAQAELELIAAQAGAGPIATSKGSRRGVQPLTAEMNRDGRRILLPLFGAAALVLLIACGNTAALLLVRGLQRQQEYAVRSALGVGRVALFRQVSIESLLLAAARRRVRRRPRVWHRQGVQADWRTRDSASRCRHDRLAGAGVRSRRGARRRARWPGCFPPCAPRGSIRWQVLKSAGPKSSAGRGERRLLRAVTMVQTALTLALLVGAGLLIRTMSNLANVRIGLQHRSHPDDDGHRGAGRLGGLSHAGAGARRRRCPASSRRRSRGACR